MPSNMCEKGPWPAHTQGKGQPVVSDYLSLTAHTPLTPPRTKVVTETSYPHTQHILISDPQLRLPLSNGAHKFSRQMSHTTTHAHRQPQWTCTWAYTATCTVRLTRAEWALSRYTCSVLPICVQCSPNLPQGVFKPVVAGPGVHKVLASKLFDVAQTLELWSVNDSYHQGVELNVAMHWVVEHLQVWNIPPHFFESR